MGIASSAPLVRYLPLILVTLVACPAPPTADQITSRAVKRNCEAQADSAAEDVRRQNAQVVREGRAFDADDRHRVETLADRTREQAFKECMLRYSV